MVPLLSMQHKDEFQFSEHMLKLGKAAHSCNPSLEKGWEVGMRAVAQTGRSLKLTGQPAKPKSVSFRFSDILSQN